MEVLVGSTLSIDVSAPSEFVRDRNHLPPLDMTSSSTVSAAVAIAGSSADCGLARTGSGIWSGQMVEYSSESSSSIGSPGDSEEENDSGGEDDSVLSKEQGLRGLGSLSSLEDSLPVKRGLSNHYKGKSKSFGNLAEINCVKEVEKQENPLNKRRRLQICNKWSRRSFYAWQNPKSMPLLQVNEDDEEDEDGEDSKSGFDESKSSASSSSDEGLRKTSFKSRGFKSRSCFALSDLQEEDDQ